MVLRKPQIVGNLIFKTKKDLHTYTQQLLERKMVCIIDSSNADFLFLLSLYSRKPSHQSYIQSIKKFKISLDPIKKDKANHLSCIDTYNKEFVFSWRDCCDGVDTKTTDKLQRACRMSIKDQTSSCWSNNDCCNNCGKDKAVGFEVDHLYEFSKIFKNFVDLSKLQIPIDFTSDATTSQCIFKKEDYMFKQAFQNYHQENAVLQLLCKECHRDKTNMFISKQ